jgi:hypothetical protein
MGVDVLIVPDTQGHRKRSTKHLEQAGRLVAEKRPQRVMMLGDFGDMPSLSFWDRGKKRSFGFTVQNDIDHMGHMLEVFMKPFKDIRGYKPDLHMLEGNHDGCEECEGTRMYRFIQDNHQLSGTYDPMETFRENGWRVHHFQHLVVLDGVYYSHLFPKASTGNVTARGQGFGASNARLQANANMVSCTAGHKPGLDWSIRPATGRIIHTLIAGSFYHHDEHYKGPQGNDYWRGLFYKKGVRNGEYDHETFSMRRLRREYA